MYLFDTNVLSELTKPRGNTALTSRLLDCDRACRFASEITRYEMRYGAALRPDDKGLWPAIEREVIPRFSWLPVDAKTSLCAGDIGVLLRRRGETTDWPDLFIAATAVAHGLIVVTRNTRHFERVPGLAIENWFPSA